ncbi:isocitrate dehydrogenase [Nitrobacter sp. Nb-311A]|nr:isocitrate dehydrogenase [Nitrobacter sp. Nb-311A]
MPVFVLSVPDICLVFQFKLRVWFKGAAAQVFDRAFITFSQVK